MLPKEGLIREAASIDAYAASPITLHECQTHLLTCRAGHLFDTMQRRAVRYTVAEYVPSTIVQKASRNLADMQCHCWASFQGKTVTEHQETLLHLQEIAALTHEPFDNPMEGAAFVPSCNAVLPAQTP